MGLKMRLEAESSFAAEITVDEYTKRLKQLHKQAFTSREFDFSRTMRNIFVPPAGYYSTDPQIFYDGKRWHLFYVTGKTEYADMWLSDFRKGDFAAANKHPYEEIGDGHAVGESLFEFRFHGRAMTEPQGEFSSLLQGDGFAVKHGDRWVYVVSNRGPLGQSMGLAYSPDLYEWTFDPANPFWTPPAYATVGKCAGAFILQYKGRYFIYYMLTSSLPINGVGLLSTADFRSFEDHGLVFLLPTQFRGTASVESPCVVHKDGLWHLFFGSGTGWWHIVSDVPDNFMGHADWSRDRGAHTGMYCMGPFHAARLLETPDGAWYMYSTSKEERRRQHREAGIYAARGSMKDESSLQEGIFLAQVEWQGDRPVLLEW